MKCKKYREGEKIEISGKALMESRKREIIDSMNCGAMAK
jgi:hypothetical protein